MEKGRVGAVSMESPASASLSGVLCVEAWCSRGTMVVLVRGERSHQEPEITIRGGHGCGMESRMNQPQKQ
jgi:hypothetical protein